ncbi:hypothetical protein T439DRAFT_329794 [Meredithblackwellia eburnea MCA 4105]
MAVDVPQLTLYSAKICPWAQRSTLAVQEVGATYNHVEIDLKNKPEWYASKVNPASKVPVIQVGDDKSGVKVPESHVILELIADLFKDSNKSILPETPLARAEARYFIERFNQIVWTPFTGVLWQKKVENLPLVLDGLKEIQELLKRHEGPFFLGEKISIADLGVAPFVGRLIAFAKAGFFKDNGDFAPNLLSSEEYATFRAYHDTLTSRPSWPATFDENYIIETFRARLAAL